MNIEIEHHPSQERLAELGVETWPIWEKEVSEFPWRYADRETCYVLEGEVTVTPDGGEAVQIQAGDLATFPEGMSCTWKVTRDLRKHYRFG
jgi:uncharacterized cupin superfamily protein